MEFELSYLSSPVVIGLSEHISLQAPWGFHLVLNLYGCEKKLITSAKIIEKFVIELCQLTEMKMYGNPLIVRFGEKPNIAGYSLVQLIETSSISGHFVDETRTAYLDIFSCKAFNPEIVSKFCIRTFKASKVAGRMLYRE